MTTIVTGGTKGIGLAIARQLGRKGERLVLGTMARCTSCTARR